MTTTDKATVITSTAQPIETRYAGCRFRSRLEARWAVFFDAMGIPWESEPQGFTLSDGRNYLPDFLLPQCGTWVEVKGSAERLDASLMERAARDLPVMPYEWENGPQLMILGPIPRPQPDGHDYGWNALDRHWGGRGHDKVADNWTCHGFGAYQKNRRPWSLDCAGHTSTVAPCLAFEVDNAQDAYAAARAARFEHGESGSA